MAPLAPPQLRHHCPRKARGGGICLGSTKRNEFASLNITGVFACMCDVAPLLLLFCSRHVSSCCGVCWSRGSAVQCSAHWACPQSTQKSPKPELVDRITFILYDPVRLGGGYAASAATTYSGFGWPSFVHSFAPLPPKHAYSYTRTLIHTKPQKPIARLPIRRKRFPLARAALQYHIVC